MNNINNLHAECYGCGACRLACPVSCINMLPDKFGFRSPVIDEQKCVNCGRCLDICPAEHPDNDQQPLRKAYYGWNTDLQVRSLSSSGGIYSALAEHVLQQDGVVIGAIYHSQARKVMHVSSDDFDFSRQRKSKYVESDLGETFSIAAQAIKSERPVLFSGTPCQIAGLRRYLPQCEKLTTIDFICHGVPPMQLLAQHIALLEQKYGSPATDINFRPKTQGWFAHFLKVDFANGAQYLQQYSLDPFFLAFSKNMILRSSCYSCPFTTAHVADLTLADFWHIHKFAPEIDATNGVSLVHVNTEKGDRLLSACSPALEMTAIDWNEASYCLRIRNRKVYNIAARNKLFALIHQTGFHQAIVRTFWKYLIKGKIKQIIKRLLRR